MTRPIGNGSVDENSLKMTFCLLSHKTTWSHLLMNKSTRMGIAFLFSEAYNEKICLIIFALSVQRALLLFF